MNVGTDLRETVKPLKSMAILKRTQVRPKTQRTRDEQRPTHIATPRGFTANYRNFARRWGRMPHFVQRNGSANLAAEGLWTR